MENSRAKLDVIVTELRTIKRFMSLAFCCGVLLSLGAFLSTQDSMFLETKNGGGAMTSRVVITQGNLSAIKFQDSEMRLQPPSTGGTAELKFYELAANGTNYVGLKAPDLIGTDKMWKLPAADGAADNILKTDGAGNLSFVAASTVAVTSVSAGNSTISVGGTATAPTVSINLGNANTWTAAQTFSANTNFPGSGIWNTSGNVGIGTTSPNGKLDVAGGYATSGLSIPQGLAVSAGGASPDRAQVIWGDNSGWKLHFGTRDGSGNFQSRVTFMDTGNVGIGTTGPGAKLEVGGTLKVTGAGIYNSAGNQLVETNATDWTRWNQGSGATNGNAMYQSLALGTGGLTVGAWENQSAGVLKVVNSAYLCTSSGSVGIGTTGPGEKLEVNGNIKLSGGSPTYKVTNLAAPTANADAATKAYVDAQAGGGGKSKSQFFTSGGSFTVPTNVTLVWVTAWGGGGGGGGCEILYRFPVTVTSAEVIAVTVGAGGAGGSGSSGNPPSFNSGGTGGDTIFGSYLTAKGGAGGAATGGGGGGNGGSFASGGSGGSGGLIVEWVE